MPISRFVFFKNNPERVCSRTDTKASVPLTRRPSSTSIRTAVRHFGAFLPSATWREICCVPGPPHSSGVYDRSLWLFLENVPAHAVKNLVVSSGGTTLWDEGNVSVKENTSLFAFEWSSAIIIAPVKKIQCDHLGGKLSRDRRDKMNKPYRRVLTVKTSPFASGWRMRDHVAS